MEVKTLAADDAVERLLFMSDLHGLLEPLDAFDELRAGYAEPSQVIVGGDLFVVGVKPAETVDWVRENAGQFAVLGNHDIGALKGSDGHYGPYTEPGSYECLDAAQIEYMRSLPEALEVRWRGKRIRLMHGHRTLAGEAVSWLTKPRELTRVFADPEVDLTVIAHTHYPFVRETGGTLVANCGSMGMVLLGYTRADGTVEPQGDESTFTPVPRALSSFLSMTTQGDALSVDIVRFDYDRDRTTEMLREAGDPDFGTWEHWLNTGVYRLPAGYWERVARSASTSS